MKHLFSTILLLTALFFFGQTDTTIHYDSEKEFLKAKPPKGYTFLMNHYDHWAVTFTRKLKGYEKKDTTLKSIPTKVVLITYKQDCQEVIFNYLKGFEATIIDYLDGIIICNLPKKYPIGKFIVDTKRVPCVIDAEQDIIHPAKHETLDPRFNEQWSLNNSTDKDVDAVEAWRKFEGRTTVETSVAFFDGAGYDFSHVDGGNIPYKLNAVDGSVNAGVVGLYEKHGTAVMGIAMAKSNNNIGIAGLGNNLLTGMAVKIGYNSQSTGTFYTSSTAKTRAYYYAASIPSCGVISNSYGSTGSSTSDQTAINYFIKNARNGKGGLVFASTGNSGATIWKNYPASYKGVIGVGATTSNDTRASFSNYSTGLCFSAPGQSILTLDNSGATGYNTTDYTSFSGTSASCPVAATVGALLFAYKPELTNKQAYEILVQGCEKTGGYLYQQLSTDSTTATWSTHLGYGRINVYNVLNLADGVTPVPTPDPVPDPTPDPTPTPGITDMEIEFQPAITYFTDSTGYVKFQYLNKGTVDIKYVQVSVGFPGSQQLRTEVRYILRGKDITISSQKFTIPKGGARYSLTILKVNGSPDINPINDYDDIWIDRRK